VLIYSIGRFFRAVLIYWLLFKATFFANVSVKYTRGVRGQRRKFADFEITEITQSRKLW